MHPVVVLHPIVWPEASRAMSTTCRRLLHLVPRAAQTLPASLSCVWLARVHVNTCVRACVLVSTCACLPTPLLHVMRFFTARAFAEVEFFSTGGRGSTSRPRPGSTRDTGGRARPGSSRDRDASSRQGAVPAAAAVENEAFGGFEDDQAPPTVATETFGGFDDATGDDLQETEFTEYADDNLVCCSLSLATASALLHVHAVAVSCALSF